MKTSNQLSEDSGRTTGLAVAAPVRCPSCGREDVMWHPAPDQRDNEDSMGPHVKVAEYWHPSPARLSPPDASGKTHLLVVREPGKSPSYWPAELNCPRCVPEGRAAAAAWNAFMGRNSSPNIGSQRTRPLVSESPSAEAITEDGRPGSL